ncbi:MAG: F0F1 ATP synthase subunit A [Candidatus Scalindua sp. AMX11]|nr:MAG: F0F1 ATP synthase subunit A [Candidatus Scalindua sp.]NOG84693.1 F0F1 ATP synthase subunit A [Planctomycetota bacterium]RZV98306.1 MAG: F0F1 ATP synthase subunit A [Candidatus Scalindua sp. SCAELEC01]TDE66602.1 MAG: F0F1 ATP synthase subunit A [Candidatus Scalindua sp. AMX11]GJQ58977.1 MAG: ATP synthase subunit a [Candidatus Scalindua sp.]
MEISPDLIIFRQWGQVTLNATIVFTWVIMIFLTIGSWIVTRKLSAETKISRWQNILEILVTWIQDQIQAISHRESYQYLPFVGTLFLFIAVSNLLTIVPWYQAPTGSLSTTVALAVCVFIATPLFGIMEGGLKGYFRSYIKPTFFMLPFNIIGEISRTLALAVRLFGNIMSGSMIAGILLSVTPLFFPIIMQALGLLTGLVQAYIFAVLAMVYIASAMQVHKGKAIQESEH